MATNIGSKPNTGTVKHEIKEEPLSEELGCRIKLGIRKNNNGKWEITKRGDAKLMPSSDNDQTEHFENGNCINLTSNNDNEKAKDLDPGQYDYPTSNVHDLDSSPIDEHGPPVPREQDIIVLSDSDDENVTVLSPSALNCSSAHDTGDPFPPNPPEISGTCGEQPGGGPDETSFLVLNEDFDVLGLSFWEHPLNPQDDPVTQFTNNLGEVQNYAANHQSLHEPVSGGNSIVAPAANPLGYGHEGVLQASLGLSCTDESLVTAKNASQKRMNPGDASVLDDLTGERPGGPFSPPRQPRSVRPRLVLTIDSDSD